MLFRRTFPTFIKFKLETAKKSLSHEFKIASRIELHLGIPRNGRLANNVEECDFIILGFCFFFQNMFIIFVN
jgi:hypothetical protein